MRISKKSVAHRLIAFVVATRHLFFGEFIGFNKYLVLILSVAFFLFAKAGSAQSLSELIELAYKNNPSISASKSLLDAEESLVASKATLEDPLIGVSTLDRDVRTQYATISQKVRFPIKYYLQAKAQGSKANSYKSKLKMEKLEIRQQVASLYYAIYSSQKIIQMTQANMQAVKEFARVAEKKYAAGKSPQGDSMKAHFELTHLELDLIRLKQEEEALQESIKAILNEQSLKPLQLAHRELTLPAHDPSKIAQSISKLTSVLQANSPSIMGEIQRLKEMEYQSSLAKWEYAPDFQFQYQQRISGEPENSQIYSVGITFPLWFWKKGSEASAAMAKKTAQEFRVTDMTQKLIANVKDLKGKVEAGAKTLKIYETSLIPQAQGAYKSARAAYQANKTSFLDLLDSERSLYRVKTGFFQSLRQYISYLTQLEAQLGYTISDLEKKGEVVK